MNTPPLPVPPVADCTWSEVGPTARTVTIGHPFPGVRVHVVIEDPPQPGSEGAGRRLREAPPGFAGVLYVGGSTLSTGYLDNKKLTAARFLRRADCQGGRGWPCTCCELLYRTGDIARVGPRGDLEYLGRADNQVKVRGMRVELSAVEAALLALPGVEAAAAYVHDEGDGMNHLRALVVPASLSSSKIINGMTRGVAGLAVVWACAIASAAETRLLRWPVAVCHP